MANIFEVDTEMLKSDAQTLGDMAQRFANSLEEVGVAVETLNGSWEGAAKETFMANFLQDKAEISELVKFICDISDAMLFAQNAYDECEEEVRSIIAGI